MIEALTVRSGLTARPAAPVIIARYGIWIGAAVVFAVLPLVLRSGTALTLMSLMGISIVFALSYNMLLGQTGLLSFGHAVYFGLGAYFAVHCMNAVTMRDLPVPLPVIPFVGGLGGLAFAIAFGWVSTRRSGTAFAMISLGLAELVGSSALILRSFFGGEEGVTTDRTRLLRLFGISFGQQIEVYYLIAVWCLVCMFLMHKFTRTPLGRMCNAVRDNAERAQFVGYNPQVVRFLAFCASGFFAGVAGGLAAVHFEIANSAYFSASQSGNVLLATFVGGSGYFLGPVVGAVLVSYLQVMLSDVTEIWQLYFGLLFIIMVMFAPQGIVGLLMMHRPLWRKRGMLKVMAAYVIALPPALIMLAGVALVIEMTYHLTVKAAAEGSVMTFFTVPLATDHLAAWLSGGILVVGGFILFRLTWPLIAAAWASVDPGKEQAR
ncbi:MAG TPA: branched-chain amino acid ABC transporter permease [Xanthobacteraceae bacterium]|nr:branched-chain amino acid ABC transporter permease [Xanthobacteraceae bacterium]